MSHVAGGSGGEGYGYFDQGERAPYRLFPRLAKRDNLGNVIYPGSAGNGYFVGTNQRPFIKDQTLQ